MKLNTCFTVKSLDKKGEIMIHVYENEQRNLRIDVLKMTNKEVQHYKKCLETKDETVRKILIDIITNTYEKQEE